MIKGTAESTVTVNDRAGLDQLVKDVRQGRYEDYLKEYPLEHVSIRDGLGPWEEEWDEMYEECEGCEEGGECEEDEDVDVGVQVFIQVDVDSATDVAVYYDSDSDATMDVDEEVSAKPCVGQQYVWQA